MRITYFILFIVVLVISKCQSSEVCDQKLHNCTSMMRPVLNEVRYMFPTTQMEIEGMCKVWSHIMDCVRKYVIDCSSEEQRNKFNDAVSNSIDSVHAICSSERYRRDYLEYATCFRKVSMDNCGHHFKKMVDSAYDPYSPETHICCAYQRFEKCVSEPIQQLCGPQALHILDDSMSSLKARCDTVTQSLKPSEKMCPADTISNNYEPMPQRPALRHIDPTYSPLTTANYMMSGRTVPPWSTPSWTQKTVIYPLPTRHSSRIYRRSYAESLHISKHCILVAALLMFILF